MNKYEIGQQFTDRRGRCHTITDILKTYNSAGELVDLRYVTVHEFLGQLVEDRTYIENSIAIAIGMRGQ